VRPRPKTASRARGEGLRAAALGLGTCDAGESKLWLCGAFSLT
jgi:hypothetical protein